MNSLVTSDDIPAPVAAHEPSEPPERSAVELPVIRPGLMKRFPYAAPITAALGFTVAAIHVAADQLSTLAVNLVDEALSDYPVWIGPRKPENPFVVEAEPPRSLSHTCSDVIWVITRDEVLYPPIRDARQKCTALLKNEVELEQVCDNDIKLGADEIAQKLEELKMDAQTRNCNLGD